MLIVTGSVETRPDSFDEALALSLAHVHRSRGEPGCLLHSVHTDVENPRRLVFLEHWADAAALHAHFQVPASGEFAKDLNRLGASPPEMSIYDATPVSLRTLIG